jgi:hypothetical protein
VSFFGIRDPDERDNLPQTSTMLRTSDSRDSVVVDRRSHTIWKFLRGLISPTPVNYYDHRVARELSRVLEEQTFDVVRIEIVHLVVYLSIVCLSTIRARRSRPLLARPILSRLVFSHLRPPACLTRLTSYLFARDGTRA